MQEVSSHHRSLSLVASEILPSYLKPELRPKSIVPGSERIFRITSWRFRSTNVDATLFNPEDLKTDPVAASAAYKEYTSSRRGPLTVLANSVCYLSLSQILSGDTLEALAQKARDVGSGDFPERDEIRRKRFDSILGKLGQIEYFL